MDTRTYIKLHDGMPDHPKIDALSDRAFRLLVTTWCWCSRHLTDGRIPRVVWDKRGAPSARKELVDAGLVEFTESDVYMHDYLDHQRSKDEVLALREKRQEAGKRGGNETAKRKANARANAKPTNGKTIAVSDTETDIKSMTPTGSALPATNGRRDAAIANKHLQRLEPILASGSSFDLLHEFRELWEPAWQEAIDQGIAPKSVGRNLLAAFIASVTDTDPDYGRAGQLVGRYGKLALLGIDEGLIANADDPYRYAHRVCSNQSAAHRSEV